MKKDMKKKTVLINLFLTFIVAVVFSVSFFPTAEKPIYIEKQELYAIYNGNRESNKVSFMINVYENTEIVKSMIEVFKFYGGTATFFVGGCWADDNGETLNEIVSNGFEIGNHGYFHKDHKRLSYEESEKEIINTGEVVKALCGKEPTLFAPPSGSFSSETLSSAYNNGYKVIMWSKDTIDWRDKDENTVYKRATEKLSGGDLVLMHPKEHTLRALPRILEYCVNNNLKICTVSDNLA